MTNTNQCSQKLIYNSFSIILFQTFTSPSLAKKIVELKSKGILTPIHDVYDDIDSHVFTVNEVSIKRYYLPSFNCNIEICESDNDEISVATIKGEIKVQATEFFDNTVQLSYHITVDKSNEKSPCETNRPLFTDEIIALGSMIQHAEHWSLNEETNKQEISETLKSANITLCNSISDTITKSSMKEVCSLYQKLFDKHLCTTEHNYTLIDIYEDIEIEEGKVSFANMSEPEIIEHIELYHKPELIGLMSFYPREWPFRQDRSFNDICGDNIAIDTDDLVLANQNVCVVFGTYGKRGEESETDWKEHLKARSIYNTSWPEYVLLLELILVKKQVVNFVLNEYLNNKIINRESNEQDEQDTDMITERIHENAKLCVDMLRKTLKLNAINYLRFVSHRHMYKLTARNLEIEVDKEILRNTINNIDRSLVNANNVMEAKQAKKTENLLYFISIASLFGVLMENNEVPVLSMLVNDYWGKGFAVLLEVITALATVYALYKFIQAMRKKRKRNQNQYND